MINRILMEMYDKYEKNKDKEEIEKFAIKTFKDKDAQTIFIASVLILFSNCNGFKPRYDATRENLLEIVLASKEKMNGTNLLKYYAEKINTEKYIVKYLNTIDSEESFQNGADIVIDYLENFKSQFIKDIKRKIDKNNL